MGDEVMKKVSLIILNVLCTDKILLLAAKLMNLFEPPHGRLLTFRSIFLNKQTLSLSKIYIFTNLEDGKFPSTIFVPIH